MGVFILLCSAIGFLAGGFAGVAIGVLVAIGLRFMVEIAAFVMDD